MGSVFFTDGSATDFFFNNLYIFIAVFLHEEEKNQQHLGIFKLGIKLALSHFVLFLKTHIMFGHAI